MSVLRTVRKRKKVRKLGSVTIIRREAYADLELDAKVELIRSLIPLGLMHVQELLDQEVTALASERYARKDASVSGRRHGSNPGTVGLAGQRVPIRVPRIRRVAGSEIPLRSYEAVRGDRDVDDLLLRRVLYGISCRNYAAAAAAIPGAIGLSSSTVSRGFIQASAAQLRAFQERDLSGEDVVAVFLDGKTFADATMVIALGITLAGEKRFLGFVETDTENATVLTPFLRSLIERGLDVSQGVLVILDGGKGLRTAVRKAFRGRALVQRCQWHKRENVVSYLAKGEQTVWRQRLQRAYNRPDYDEALGALETLHGELDERNQSAADSLAEGLDETLTLHRLGVYGMLGRSLKTTNCLESVNALVEERCAKVDHWQSSSQRHRWLATALLDIEPRLRRVRGYRHLPSLRAALKRELKIDTTSALGSSVRPARQSGAVEFQLRMGLTRSPGQTVNLAASAASAYSSARVTPASKSASRPGTAPTPGVMLKSTASRLWLRKARAISAAVCSYGFWISAPRNPMRAAISNRSSMSTSPNIIEKFAASFGMCSFWSFAAIRMRVRACVSPVPDAAPLYDQCPSRRAGPLYHQPS